MIRDKRRIDPITGAAREPKGSAPSEPPPRDAAPDGQLAELTDTLQRVTAEYANYRKRTERDRVLVVELAQDRLLASLLPVLDDIDRAHEHGDVTGPLKAVAEQLSGVLAKHGLETFGQIGDSFDPGQHEAVMHSTSAEVDGPTCIAVMRRGYRRGERVLRPAMVAVADPAEPAGETAEQS